MLFRSVWLNVYPTAGLSAYVWEKYNFTTIFPWDVRIDQFGQGFFSASAFDGSVAAQINGTTIIPTGQWVHLAISRQGNNFRAFIDGIQEGATDTNLNVAAGDNAANMTIGATVDGSGNFDGWIGRASCRERVFVGV